MSQFDLFDKTTAPEPAPASEGAARLKVQKSGPGKLSPAQQRFNKLLARVDSLGRQLQEVESLGSAVRAPHLERMAALQQQIQKAQADMLLFLHDRLQRKGLSVAQQKSVRAVVQSLLEAVDPGGEDPQWAALHAAYHSPEALARNADARQDGKRQMIDALEDSLGVSLDLDDLDQFESHEQLLGAVMRQLQERAEAEQERKTARKAKRPPTARQAKAQAQAQDAKAALRTMYRQLASALHPDRETDPAERERKSALMSQANAAYERGDLTTLLRLQLQAEQVDHASIARMADDRLEALSLLLKEQVAVLELEVLDAEMRLSHELGIMVNATMKAPMVHRVLQEVQQDIVDVVESMQHDLERVRDDAELKRWLREQSALARQHERDQAMMMQFGEFI